MAVSFKGGVRIRVKGDRTDSCESRPVMSCDKHIYPIVGDNGVSYVPVVKAGDSVKVGQKLAFSADSWELPLHCSVSGRVEGIINIETRRGSVQAVAVINDELYERSDSAAVIEDYKSEDRNKVIAALQNAGIADMEGGEFICGEALMEVPPRYLILSIVDAEPYMSAYGRRAAENAAEVVEGAKLAKYLLGARYLYIAVESKNKEAMDAIRGALRYDDSVSLIAVGSKYPQENKNILVKTITGKDLPESDYVITNPEAVYAMITALRTGMPVTERIVTVAGDGVAEPDNFRVPFGVPASVLISWAKGVVEPPESIIFNGVMNGEAQPNDGVPTTKNVRSVNVLRPKNNKGMKDCIHCGRCVVHCPKGLVPFKLSKASLSFKLDKAIKYRASECNGCGVCTYVCPSQIPLAENILSIAESIRRLRGEGAAR